MIIEAPPEAQLRLIFIFAIDASFTPFSPEADEADILMLRSFSRCSALMIAAPF